LTDIQLIQACLQHDRNSQKLLFDRYSGQMYPICLRYCRTQAEAQDALLMGFTKVFHRLHSYKEEGPLGAWIRKIIVRTCIDLLRSQKSLPLVSLDHVQVQEPSVVYHESMTYDEMIKIVNRMPDGYRFVFCMAVIDEMSHAEIAQALGITESTSRTQLVKARKYLQSRITNKLNLYQ